MGPKERISYRISYLQFAHLRSSSREARPTSNSDMEAPCYCIAFSDFQAKTAMSEEKLLLQTLDHPYIVRLRASFQTPDKLFMIMDFLSGGDCYYLMTQNKFPEAVVRIHAAQVSRPMQCIPQMKGDTESARACAVRGV